VRHAVGGERGGGTNVEKMKLIFSLLGRRRSPLSSRVVRKKKNTD
jgi:hypothetical protein